MATFTELAPEDVHAVCDAWGLGAPQQVHATAHGIENSNFFLTTETTAGQRLEWVLTLGATEFSPVAIDVLVRLDHAGLPVPVPIPDRCGERIGRVAGCPALVAPRLPGDHPHHPTPGQCAAIGRFLARMHRVTADLDGPPHPRDATWIRERIARHEMHLGAASRQRLHDAHRALEEVAARRDWQRLPSGLVHGDLFRDNALFDRGGLRGVIDFHHCARAPLLFDLAVAANDWCCRADGRFDGDRLRALLTAYAALRPLTREETWFWPLLTLQAGLRFWLARLDSPRKPPAEMGAIVRRRLQEAFPLASTLSEAEPVSAPAE